MRTNSVIFFTILLCISCSSALDNSSESTATALVNPNNSQQNGDNISVHLQKSVDRANLRLVDLIWDVLFIIFEDMDTLDMLSVIEVCPSLTPVAAIIFRRKYQKIEITDALSTEVYKPKFEDTRNKSVKIRNYDLALKTLKYFGGVIDQCELEAMTIMSSERYAIMRYINKYASDSLTSLKLYYIRREESLEHFTVPFKRVEELEIYITMYGIAADIMPFNQLFPKLKRATVRIYDGVFLKNDTI